MVVKKLAKKAIQDRIKGVKGHSARLHRNKLNKKR